MEDTSKIFLKTSIFLLIIVGILVVYIELENARFSRELNNQTTHENVFKEKYKLLERQLTASEQSRVVLGHRFDSLNYHTQILVHANHALDSTLLKVRGKYQQRTAPELEAEMMKRFNAAQ